MHALRELWCVALHCICFATPFKHHKCNRQAPFMKLILSMYTCNILSTYYMYMYNVCMPTKALAVRKGGGTVVTIDSPQPLIILI